MTGKGITATACTTMGGGRISGWAVTGDRDNRSYKSLRAAKYFFELLEDLESEVNTTPLEEKCEISTHLFFACITSTASSLGAFYDECKIDLSYEENSNDKLNIKFKDMIKYYSGLSETSIKFDIGKRPAQDVDHLIDIRNEIIHFKPKWETSWTISDKIRKKIEGRGATSPFFSEAAPFFPNRCSSASFSKWSICSAFDYIDEVINLLELKNHWIIDPKRRGNLIPDR